MTNVSWYVPARRASRLTRWHKLVAGLVLIGGIGVYAVSKTLLTAPARDCPSRISILIDPSDPLPAARVIGHLKSVIDQSCLGTNAMVAAISSDPIEPLLMVMSNLVDPGRPDEHSRLFKNSRAAQRERQDHFLLPLNAAIADSLKRFDKQSKSPLIEALASLGNLPQTSNSTPHDLLIVISDLLQNSTCTFVGKSKRRTALTERCAKVIASHPATLHGAVLILLVRRPTDTGLPQDETFKRFWTDWLTNAGATQVIWREIS